VDYVLEYSTDLMTWTHLGTVASYTEMLTYFDEAVEGLRFYRARSLP
jgi:hypothetical protein